MEFLPGRASLCGGFPEFQPLSSSRRGTGGKKKEQEGNGVKIPENPRKSTENSRKETQKISRKIPESVPENTRKILENPRKNPEKSQE